PGSPAGGAAAGVAAGSTDPMAIIRGAGCLACHKVGDEGAAIGPDLSRVGARLTAAGLREAILMPDARLTPGYENFAGIMPKTFGNQLTAAQLESLVRFFGSRR
ncbi:MAG: c-type cytochrome, partial [Gemmatimonadales bacterium]